MTITTAKAGGNEQVQKFAEACANQNTEHELLEAIMDDVADPVDMDDWGLTANEWHQAIRLALREL